MAIKNANAMISNTSTLLLVVVVSNVMGTMSNVVRYNGTGTKQKKVRIPTIAERRICRTNATTKI
jgi:hypothetical protein